MADPSSWQKDAAYAGMDVELFFHPEFERSTNRARRFARARAVCAQCPVALPYRDFALKVGERYGTWGGLDELERRAMLRAARQNE